MEKTVLTPEQRKQLEELKQLEAQEQEQIKNERNTLKEMTNDTVKEAFQVLMNVSDAIAAAKKTVYAMFADIIELKKQVYQTADEQFSHTFTTEDSKLRIIIGFNVIDNFDDSHTAGVAGVLDYLNGLGTDQDSKWLVKNLKKYLARNAKGELNARKVMEMLQLANERGDQKLIDQVQIIVNAYKPIKTKLYIVARYRDEKQNAWQPLPLGITEAPLD